MVLLFPGCVAEGELVCADLFEIEAGKISAMDAGAVAGNDGAGLIFPPALEVVGGFHAQNTHLGFVGIGDVTFQKALYLRTTWKLSLYYIP